MNHSLPHTHHPAFPNQEQPLPPPPDLIDGEEHYEIEKVLDSREHKVRGKVLGKCQMVKDNSHERRSAECVGFGEAISNITLEPKP